MTKIKGYVVIIDDKNNSKPVPVNKKFLMCKACAMCLMDEMNIKKSIDPQTHIYPYKIVKATLTLEN